MTSQHPAGDDAHEVLVESSLPMLITAYDEAIHDGITEPVIFLVDCEDTLGAEMAEAWAGEDAVENAVGVEQMAREDDTSTTVFARAVSVSDCRKEIPAVFPYLAEVLNQDPPKGEFFVICVTDGGAVVLSVPERAAE